jgi:hypothetical protein
MGNLPMVAVPRDIGRRPIQQERSDLSLTQLLI